jgi:hypothetical protein
MEVDDEAHPSTQIHGRNKKNSSNHEIENRATNTSENHEKEKHNSTRKEMIQSKSTAILMQIKSLQGVGSIETSSDTLED